MYSSIAKEAMEEVWGRSPNRFQIEIIPTILQMLTKDLSPEALLLVQPTGSGKSAVPQTTSVVTNGVSIIIEPTLALSSDQSSKFDSASKEHGGLVYAYQLDLYKNDNDRQMLANSITSVLTEKKKQQDIQLGIVSFVLFTSPEALIQPVWMKLVDDLIRLEMLILICVDEVHLFIEFGLSFRKDFISLREKLFKKIISTNSTSSNDLSPHRTILKIPFLSMTATFNLQLLNLLQKMTNITFNPRLLHWSNQSD